MRKKLSLFMAAVLLLTTPGSVAFASDGLDVIVVEDDVVESESTVEEEGTETETDEETVTEEPQAEEGFIVSVEEADDPDIDSAGSVSNTAEYDGHSYRLYENLNYTWDEAKTYCESLGGHLATITSSEEQAVLADLIEGGNQNSYWIGGYMEENAWYWVTGEAFSYTRWSSGEPNNYTSQDESALVMYRLDNPKAGGDFLGAWNDLNPDGTCNDETFFGVENIGIICEWDNAQSELELEEIEDNIYVGDKFSIQATVANAGSYSDALPLSWSVSDPDGVTLSSSASVTKVDSYTAEVSLTATAVKAGKYTVTATTNDGVSASMEIEIDYFVLGEDTNQFYHTGLPYTINNSSYLRKLYVDTVLTWVGTVTAYYELDGSTSGVCHGIALSMCYGNQGNIDYGSIVSGATNYWEMGNPLNDTDFSDLIVYYQMTQYTAQGDATNTLDKDGWHVTSLEDRTRSFLKALVDEAKSSQKNETPFVFSFHYKHNNEVSGHSVVVCGYSWNGDTNCHEIKIYDENSYSGSKDALVYYTMTVSSDYSSFEFSDSNARYGGYTIEDTWTSLSYYGIEKVYSEIDTVSAVSLSSGQMALQVSVGKKFKITNDSGEWLQYDGSSYTGTMTVYDCYTAGAGDDQVWNIVVDASDSFTLSDADKGCQLICEIGEQGYSFISNGEGQVVLSADTIEVTGGTYALDIAVQSTSCDMVKITADVTGNSTISVGSDTIQVDAEGSCSDMEISSCSEFDTETQQIDDEVEKVVISQSGDIEDITYGGEDKNGLCLDSDGVYRYYVNGEFDAAFNGVVEYDGGYFFVANGLLCSDANGLNLYGNTWYFLAYGQVQTQFTGFALYDGEWFYITNGILDTSVSGLMTYDGEKFLFAEGHLLDDYSGLWLNSSTIGGDDLWYFIAAGMVQNVSQLAMYDGEWFVVKDGILDTSYNGIIEYDGATFNVRNGQLYS